MADLRKTHNNYKRQLINQWVKNDMYVLDCGCGRGGDWWKWQAARVRLAAIDPDNDSLDEAERRAHEMGLNVWFLGQGDIRQAAFAGPFDVVCYNFSLHYIFENESVLEHSLKAIKVALKPGGLLIGITPEKARAESMVNSNGLFRDKLGNEFRILGDRLSVRLSDGPFYADGAKEEPLLDGPILIQKLKALGFERRMWEPMVPRPTGLISDLYTKFVFVNAREEQDEPDRTRSPSPDGATCFGCGTH
jgi:SAM-dependent methyltransferase